MPATDAQGIRARVTGRPERIRRVKLVDRAATWAIRLGGVFIVVAVLFIFVFIFAEAMPLFRAATATPRLDLELPVDGSASSLVRGIDEYQRYAYELLSDGRFVLLRLPQGEGGTQATVESEHPLSPLGDAHLVSASRSLVGDHVAAGTSDGRVLLAQVRFRSRYEGQSLVDIDVEFREKGVAEVDPERRQSVVAVSANETDSGPVLAALLADGTIVVSKGIVGEDPVLSSIAPPRGERLKLVRLAHGADLAAASESGRVFHWDISDAEPRLTESLLVNPAGITALEWALGGNTLLVAQADGAVSTLYRARRRDEDQDMSFVRSHDFAPTGKAVVSIGLFQRDRTFATLDAEGALLLRHSTSERHLLEIPGRGKARALDVLVTPRGDALLVRHEDQSVRRFALSNPHPEVSWKALFQKVSYEGYAKPDYVWQSTGATDDFESKLSLVPLVFGTIKATVYALLFAVPLSILGALYTSQFVHPSIKARVKPTVEIMAGLPSVVVGFIAGLWLASRVERHIVPFLLALIFVPLVGTMGVLLWDRLPVGLRRRARPGMEIALILPLLLAGAGLAVLVASPFDMLVFGGDFRAWLSTTTGQVYDQRNSIVVGIAMGFAVIPIIFTIAEDSFSSVPAHLTAASLALGASRWQTATRVVLPTASPGVFSAVMVGFGRAVGETMIVLMATGNTPVMDWSIFNGMRTLSANIAVEIPEAPHGGTLYRVLFLAAGLLFLMTFFVNTVAEIVRQRLRERYRAL